MFKVPVPASLAGETLAASEVREETGCSVLAIHTGNDAEVNPSPNTALPPDAEILVIGSAESEKRFLDRYVNH